MGMGRITLRLTGEQGILAPVLGPDRRRRRWGPGTLVVALALLAGGCSSPSMPATPAPKPAAPLTPYVRPQQSVQQRVNAPGTGLAVATCASGEVALAGGWYTDWPPQAILEQSSRSGNGWQVSVQVVAGASSYVDVSAFVMCLGNVPRASVREGSVTVAPVPPGQGGSAKETCLPGEVLVGGGFSVPLGIEVTGLTVLGLNASNTWLGSILNHSGSVEGATVYFECLTAPGAQNGFVGSTPLSLPGGYGGDTQPAACPTGMLLSGGGYLDEGNTDVTASDTPGFSWWSVLVTTHPGYPQTVVAYAMCLTVSGLPAVTCATLPTDPSAAPASIGGFPGLTFPSGAVVTPLYASYGGTGQFAIQETDVCYQGTIQQVGGGPSSVYRTLQNAGWGGNLTFPYDGQTQQACASGATCFKSPFATNPEHYLSFENFQGPLTGLVTYHLRLGAPPPPPTCNPTYYPSSAPYVYRWAGFAVPPLTKESPTALGGGHAGGYTYGLCSAGTPASILTFMQGAVQAAGFSVMSATASGFHTCVPFSFNGAPTGNYQEIDITVGAGNEWGMNVTAPLFTTSTC
jgi:hypothetical protein